MTPPAEAEIGIDLIDVGDRIRDVDQDEVAKLATSMRENGLLQPVEVRPTGSGRYKLTIGAHRYSAAQVLAWTSIKAVVVDCSDDEARLHEIDENLYRHELTPYDQANFLEERRQIWEKLYGKVKPGRDKRKSRQVGAIEERDEYLNYYKDIQKNFSLPKRTVQRALERRRCIIKPIWEMLRNTPEAKNGALLDKIADLEPADQSEILKLVQDRACTFSEAVRRAAPRVNQRVTTPEKMAEKVAAAWADWSAEDQKKFMTEIRRLSGAKK